MKGLYVHIPFCIKKCNYCDFNSSAAPDDLKERYIESLICEMGKYKGEECDTVYIGGGTPTSLKAELLEKVLFGIRDNFKISQVAEFTVEMNPKTADMEKLKLMRDSGVNRLSVGVQSFCDNELRALGRVHTAEDAKEAIQLAKKAGFSNISIDLMSAVPYQTKESFAKSLDAAISQNPEHISCYSLILEEGTPLFNAVKMGEVTLCDEDTERELYDYGVDTLEKNGHFRYEISNFAKKGKESRHNLKYWNMEEYIGIGLSAHSFLGGVRFSDTDSMEEYNNHHFESGKKEILTKEDMMSEFMFLGLRKTEGVSKKAFFDRFGEDMTSVFQKPIERFLKMGFLLEENGKIRLSREAVSVSNQIMCEFII